MNRSKFIHPVQAEVRFGTELKNIYQPWYLHPNLKNLMYLAEINIRDRHGARFKTEQLLGQNMDHANTIKQGLYIKERMIKGQNILDINIEPGVPLWVLRHFLGLLPTPIFKPKTDEHYWYNFSVRYFDDFIQGVKIRKATEIFKNAVAEKLTQLPGRNLSFLFELFEMMRFLSMKALGMENEIIDKHAALVLVRFFTPSMFVRPYRPGNLTKSDKKYFAFMLFVIYFWPELRMRIHDKLTINNNNKIPNKFYYYPELYDKYSHNNYGKNIGVQTENSAPELFLQIKEEEEESTYSNLNFNSETLQAKRKYICEKLETIRIGTEGQTSQNEFNIVDRVDSEYVSKMIASTPKNTPKNTKNAINIRREELIQNISAQTFDDFYDSVKNKFIADIGTQTEEENVCNQTVPVDNLPKFSVKINSRIRKKLPKMLKKKQDIIILHIPRNTRIKYIKNAKLPAQKTALNTHKKTKNLKKTEVKYVPETAPNKSATYGWNIDLNSPEEFIFDSLNNSLPAKNLFPAQEPAQEHVQELNCTPRSSTSLFKRVTQYGWTYNPQKSSTRSSIVDLDLVENDLNKLQFCVENELSFNSITSESPLTEKNQKKKYGRFSKITSFFRMFTPKKSASCNDLQSSIKYEKIVKSANSI